MKAGRLLHNDRSLSTLAGATYALPHLFKGATSICRFVLGVFRRVNMSERSPHGPCRRDDMLGEAAKETPIRDSGTHHQRNQSLVRNVPCRDSF